MKEIKCRLCGGETHQKSGFCRPCEMFRPDDIAALKEKEKAIEKITVMRETNRTEKEGNMSEEKKKYPRPRCEAEGCEKGQWFEHLCMRHFKEKHGITRKPYQRHQEPRAESVHAKEERKPKRLSKQKPEWWKKKNVTEKTAAPTGSYIVIVDLSFYPAIHKRLLGLAQSEFRTPEMQIAKMLDEEFKRGELDIEAASADKN